MRERTWYYPFTSRFHQLHSEISETYGVVIISVFPVICAMQLVQKTTENHPATLDFSAVDSRFPSRTVGWLERQIYSYKIYKSAN